MRKNKISRKDLFWAGVATGAKREREKLEMLGTRAPEVQRELDGEAAAIRRNAAVQMRLVSQRNQEKGWGSNVHLSVTYSVGVWYVELEDASSRKVTFSHEDLSVALEEIFR